MSDHHDRLVELALEMVQRVRDIGPAWNQTWWESLTPEQRRDLPWVLAMMVDPDATVSRLLGWTWVYARDEAA